MLTPYIIPKNYCTAGDYTLAVQGPPGKRGVVDHVLVNDITEAFSGSTTGAQVLVGTVADPNAFFESAAALLASVALGGAVALTNTLPGAPLEIPRDQALLITFVAPTGTAPTGKGLITVYINWY